MLNYHNTLSYKQYATLTFYSVFLVKRKIGFHEKHLGVSAKPELRLKWMSDIICFIQHMLGASEQGPLTSIGTGHCL